MSVLQIDSVKSFIAQLWQESVLPTLMQYIAIPAKSPVFDDKWRSHGHIRSAAKLLRNWCENNGPVGTTVRLLEDDERTPFLAVEVCGRVDETVVMYGHLDKQPEIKRWRRGLGPWEPVLQTDKDGVSRLYGRGGADDGYSVFAALSALRVLEAQGVPHARCVILIEASEESGSVDLAHWLGVLEEWIGSPTLIIALDSGCGTYDRLWLTTSLRGLLKARLRVDVLSQEVHSGDAGGIVTSSFRTIRTLLDQIEDRTGQITIPELNVGIPDVEIERARVASNVIGQEVWKRFPWRPSNTVELSQDDLTEFVLNRAWRSSLEVTGVDGIPSLKDASNVLRPFTTLQLALRIPPSVNAQTAEKALRKAFGRAGFESEKWSVSVSVSEGWIAPVEVAWLTNAVNRASAGVFGHEAVRMGEGGAIPFVKLFGAKFPNAQFIITGVLGPGANAHGPNEFLHIQYAQGISACVASIIAAHATHSMS